MANSGVAGIITDDAGAPLSGAFVGAFDTDGLFGDRLLRDSGAPLAAPFAGFVRSAADGSFVISYTAGKYTLQVRVFSHNKRLLGSAPVVPGATSPLVTLAAPIRVNAAAVTAAAATGWLVADGAFPTAITGSNVDFRIDNQECWDEVITAVDAAATSIHWMLFYLDIGKCVFRFDATNVPATGGRLEEALKAAAKRNVVVRLVCNDLIYSRPKVEAEGRIVRSLPYPVHTAKQVEAWFAQNAPAVQVRRLKTPAYIPIHTKFVVIDNSKAFIFGSPFVQDYYDDSRHAIDNPRHGDFCNVPCQSHGIKQPTHDVSLFVTGAVLGPLNETFALHWNAAKASGEPDLPPIAPPSPVASNGTVQITRTLAGNGRFPAFPRGETTILDSYLRAIGKASDFIYLENQYFTCEEIADALILAVKTKPDLNVIFLTNNAVDIPGYKKWQPATILRVRSELTEEEFGRVGFFTLWSHEPPLTTGGKTRICRNYVHSKVAIVDDLWATVGSANLDGDSLAFSQNSVRDSYWFVGGEFGLRQEGTLTENRESETNLVVYNGVDGQPSSTLPAELRRRLWAEHLGLATSATDATPNPQHPLLATKPDTGWLKLWRIRATEKVNKLKAAVPTVGVTRVLPYPTRLDMDTDWPAFEARLDWHVELQDPQSYLEAFSIDVSKLALLKHYRRFSWDTKTWVDDE